MASQHILIFAIVGPFAEELWHSLSRWSDARQTDVSDCWTPEDWRADVQAKVDRAIEKLIAYGFTPPILYRSEHIDLWSMAEVFDTALSVGSPDISRTLLTSSYELIATWVDSTTCIVPDQKTSDETQWLYARLNEAFASWGAMADRRLVILVRQVLGGLWSDSEVEKALKSVPEWWNDEYRPG